MMKHIEEELQIPFFFFFFFLHVHFKNFGWTVPYPGLSLDTSFFAKQKS